MTGKCKCNNSAAVAAPAGSLIPTVIINDIPADVRDTINIGKAANAKTMCNLKLALLRAQNELKAIVVSQADFLERRDKCLAAVTKKLKPLTVPGVRAFKTGVELLGRQFSTEVRGCELEVISDGGIKLTCQLHLKFGEPESTGSSSETFVVGLKCPAMLHLIGRQLWHIRQKSIRLSQVIRELREDIDKSAELGMYVDGAEAMLSLSPEKCVKVDKHIKDYSEFLSASGKRAVAEKTSVMRQQLSVRFEN